MRNLKRQQRWILTGVTVVGLVVATAAATAVANADADATGHGYYYRTMNMESSYDSETGMYVLKDATRGGLAVLDGVGWRADCGSQAVRCQEQNTERRPVMTDEDNDWGDLTRDDKQSQAVDAYYSAAKAWDYFAEVHGRRGIAGDGRGVAVYANMNMTSTQVDWLIGQGNGAKLAPEDCDYRGDPAVPHVGDPAACIYTGAADRWQAVVPGPGTTTDLVGGAYALGVVRNTAKLTGHPEGPGLAMATAHIFGSMIEFYANDNPDYLISERQRGGSSVWYMADPARNVGPGLSSIIEDPKLVSCYSAKLAGFPEHEKKWKAGPADFFFYLLSAGSPSPTLGRAPTCDRRPVTGIGNAKAEKIWYRALTQYMNESTNYAGARIATLKAAADLYGDHGLEYNTVNSAWAAVSVRGGDPFPGGSAPRLTNPGDQRTRLGNAVNLQLEATDPRGLPLTYFLETDYEDPGDPEFPNAPYEGGQVPGLRLNPATGLITGKPTKMGDYRVSITATNSIGEATNTWFMWKVY